MHAEEIRAALLMGGSSVGAIAAQLSVTSSAVSQVIAGRSVSDKIQRAISTAIGRPHDEVWAEHFQGWRRYTRGPRATKEAGQ